MVTDTIKRQKLLEEGIDPDLAEEVESQPLPDQQNPTVNPTAEVIQVKPKGMLGKAWDAANYQFVPPEAMREGLFGTARNIIFGDTGMPSVKETIDALGPENTPRYLRAAGEAEKGISSVASSLVTPLGIATAAVGPALKTLQVAPKTISTIGRIIASLFAVPAAKHTLEAAPEVYKAATGEDPISAISPAIETAGSALIAGLAGKYALTKANIPVNPLTDIRARHVASGPLIDVESTVTPVRPNVVEPVPSGSQSLALDTGTGIIPGTIKTKSFESSPYITEKGGLDALDREAKAKEAEAKLIKDIASAEKGSQHKASNLAAIYKSQDKAVAKHFDMTPEQFASIHNEGKAELRDLYKTQTEQQIAVKEPVVEKSAIKDQPASNLQPVPFEQERLAAEARPAQPRAREGIYSEDEPLKQKRDELIQEEANKAQELKDAVNKANAETDPTKRVALFSNVDRIRSEFRSVMKRTDSITSGEKNPSINQEGPSLQEVASKRQEPLVKAAEEQKVPLTISKAWDSAFKELAKQRNVTIDSSGRVFKSDGTEVSGEAFVRDGIKDVLTKINRVKGDVATYPHELFHPFLRDLIDRGTPVEKALVSRAFKVLEKSPSYLEWKAARDSEGKNATTEEYLTTLVGEDTVRRALQLDKKGSFKNWMSDFWSHVKQKFGKGTEADFARLMSRKLTTDLPFDQTFGMKGGDVTNAKQEENKRQEVLGSKLSEGDTLGKSSSDTSKFTPKDVDTYKNLKSQMQDMIEKDDFSSPEFRDTWQKLEEVKNKYGGKSLETSESPIDKMRQVVDETPEATTTPTAIEPNVGTRVNEDAMRRRGNKYSEGESLYSDEPTKLRLVTESPLPNESPLPKDVAEIPKEASPEIETQSAPWGLKFLAPRFARIGVEIPTPTGNYVSQQLTRFSAWMNRMEGQIGGKQLQLIRQHKLTEPEAQTIVKYLWQMDDAGKSNIKLSSKLDNFIQDYTTLIRQPRELQNELGLKVKEGGDFRVGGIKKEGYFPNMLDPQVAYEWAKNPTSEASKSYDKLYLNHLTKRGVDLKEAQETLNGYKAAIGYQARPEVEFGALRKAEGKGLPYELIDKNLAHVMSRYGRRSARDLAFFKYIQDDPKMLKALNMHDQYGQRVDAEKYPEIDNIGSNSYVQKAMRSVFNIESAQFNEHVSAAARLTGNVVMGIGTAAKNLISMPTFIAPYLKISQLPKFVEAFTKLNETKARAYENNAIRASFADFDTTGDFSIHPNPTIKRLAQASYILRKYQGRELSDKMEGWYNYTLGELLAHDNLASAKAGDKTAQSFMKRFGDTVDGGVERLFKPDEKVTADDIGAVAKRFTDAVRGTYSAEGLPSFAIEGPMAPFTALSRFSIEKSNTIWKDVILPMKSGNISPLLKLTFAGLLTGAAIEKLNELLTNKRGVDPTIKETIESGSKEALVAKVIGLLQLSSTAGIVTDAVKSGMNLLQRKDIKYNNPLSFPLYSMTIDVLGKNLSDAVEALRDGDSILDVLPSFIQALATQSNQTYRYLDANVFHPEEAKRKEKFRDLRAFKELEGENVPSSGELPNIIEGKQLKKFKRTSDMTEAAQLLPSLLNKAFEKADGSYEKFKKEIEKIQRNSYQTMPSPNNKPPESFLRYMLFLEKTQGRDAANERLKDYLIQNAANKVKSQAVSLKE